MDDREAKSLQAKEKKEMAAPAEQMKEGPTFTPLVDIYETETDIIVMADLPGVKAEDMDIDLKDNILTLEGDVASPEEPNEVEIAKEYEFGKYFRQFTLSEVIDQSKIDAGLKDGVLRLKLPKVQAATPQKIKIKAG